MTRDEIPGFLFYNKTNPERSRGVILYCKSLAYEHRSTLPFSQGCFLFGSHIPWFHHGSKSIIPSTMLGDVFNYYELNTLGG